MNGICEMNEENLISAIKTCYKNPRYSVLVYTTNIVTPIVRFIVDYINQLSRYDKECYGVEDFIKARHDTIAFNNGSSIVIIKHYNIINPPRWCYAHEILTDGIVGSDIIEAVLAPYIRNYNYNVEEYIDEF